jgi:hypothetical protein
MLRQRYLSHQTGYGFGARNNTGTNTTQERTHMDMNELDTKNTTRPQRQETICMHLADVVSRGARFIAPVTFSQVTETSKNEATHGTAYGWSVDIDEKQQTGTASVLAAQTAREMANYIVDQANAMATPRCIREKITELNNGVEGVNAADMSRATIAAILTAHVGGQGDKLGKTIGVRALSAPWASRKEARRMNQQDRDDASMGNGAFYVKGAFEADPDNEGKERLKPFANRWDATRTALRKHVFAGREGGWWEQPEVVALESKKQARKDDLYDMAKEFITTRISRRKARAEKKKATPAPSSGGPSSVNMTVKQLRNTLQSNFGVPVSVVNGMNKDALVAMHKAYVKMLMSIQVQG